MRAKMTAFLPAQTGSIPLSVADEATFGSNSQCVAHPAIEAAIAGGCFDRNPDLKESYRDRITEVKAGRE